jgi:hypothetical protein
MLTFAVSSRVVAEDIVMKAMKDELSRSTQELHLPNTEKPYFVAYRVDDSDVTAMSASLGALTGSGVEKGRMLHVDMRVGDYALDNTNYLSRGTSPFGRYSGTRALPLDDDYDEIRRLIWLTTDAEYKSDTEILSSKRSVLKNRAGANYLSDFAKQDAFTLIESAAVVKVDRAAMEKLVRELSAVFKDSPEVLESGARLVIRNQYSRYINSEGSSFAKSSPVVMLNVHATGRASDGLPLKQSFDVIVRSPEQLKQADLLARTRNLAATMKSLTNAATLDRYNGPVLFENQAAAQAFAQVFAPGVVAARFPMSDEPQFESGIQSFLAQVTGPPLSDRMGGRVLPDGFEVVDNPKISSFNGKALIGESAVDDESVATRELTLVNKGYLKALLGTRTPSNEVKDTTGSRHGLGASPTNLFLIAKNGVSDDELHQKFLAMVKDRGLEYGIVVRDVGPIGLSWIARLGTATAGRNLVNEGDVEAYKVYADGHEEPIRSVEFGPVMASAFRDIVAAGNNPTVYTGPFIPTAGLIMAGMGGNMAGGDPFSFVSFVAPSLLFDEISMKKVAGPSPNPPVVPSPVSLSK